MSTKTVKKLNRTQKFDKRDLTLNFVGTVGFVSKLIVESDA